MTIESLTRKIQHTAVDGILTYTYDFRVPIAESMVVLVADAVISSEDYSITGLDSDSGGTVIFDSQPTIGETITIYRDTAQTQIVDYQPYDAFPAETHEDALDKLTMTTQELTEAFSRSIIAPISDDGSTDYTMPEYDAGKGLMWDPDTKELINSDEDINAIAIDAAASAAAALVSEIAAAASAVEAAVSASASSVSAISAAASASAAAQAVSRVGMRAHFRRISVTELGIGVFVDLFAGGASKLLYSGSELTFELGSGGSNISSEDLGNNETHYIYIDFSAWVAAGEPEFINNPALFINNTTPPVWSEPKRGYYNISDKCIHAINTNGSGEIKEFTCSNDYCAYADDRNDYNGLAPGVTWTTVTLSIPAFATMAQCYIFNQYVDAVSSLFQRAKGTTGGGLQVASVNSGSIREGSASNIITNGSQEIEIAHFAATNNTATVLTQGWYYPIGM